MIREHTLQKQEKWEDLMVLRTFVCASSLMKIFSHFVLFFSWRNPPSGDGLILNKIKKMNKINISYTANITVVSCYYVCKILSCLAVLLDRYSMSCFSSLCKVTYSSKGSMEELAFIILEKLNHSYFFRSKIRVLEIYGSNNQRNFIKSQKFVIIK